MTSNTSMQLTVRVPHLWIQEMQKKKILGGVVNEQTVHDALVRMFLDYLAEPNKYEGPTRFPRLAQGKVA